MTGFSGVLGFEVRGGDPAAVLLLDALQLVHRAASLGSVKALAGLPEVTSHAEVTPEDHAALGMPERSSGIHAASRTKMI